MEHRTLKMKIPIHIQDTHSYCEMPNGQMIFAKTYTELSNLLDMMAEMGAFGFNNQNMTIEQYKTPNLNYNR